jgi:hypothetical protein
MSEKIEKTATKKATKKTAAVAKPRAVAAPKAPKAPKVPAGDLMTFAIRLPKSESAAFHKKAGPGKASVTSRALISAYVAGDEKAFKKIVESGAAA